MRVEESLPRRCRKHLQRDRPVHSDGGLWELDRPVAPGYPPRATDFSGVMTRLVCRAVGVRGYGLCVAGVGARGCGTLPVDDVVDRSGVAVERDRGEVVHHDTRCVRDLE